MTKTPPLVIDCRQENASSDILPRPALLSSGGKWQGIHLEYHRQPPGEIPEHSHPEHLIVVSLTPNQVERWFGDRMQGETVKKGSFCILPKSVPHSCNWQQEGEIIILALEPKVITHLARESVNADRVELVPRPAVDDDPFIAQIACLLKTDLEQGCPLGRSYGESLRTALAMHLLRHYATFKHNKRNYRDGLPEYKLQQALEYIHAHLDQELGLSDMAEVAGMSQYYFCRLFSQSMGVAPYQYVIQQRVERAKGLLKERKLTLADVALACGFANQSHFTKHFRQLTGITPKAYRER